MELVAEVDGVRFVNDSKATNVESALRSIESFDAGLVPIIGGRFKGGDLRLLRDAAGRAGEGGGRDRRSAAAGARRARRARSPVHDAASLEEAVDAAFELAQAGRRGAAGAGVRELRHVSRLRGARPDSSRRRSLDSVRDVERRV